MAFLAGVLVGIILTLFLVYYWRTLPTPYAPVTRPLTEQDTAYPRDMDSE